MKTNSWTLFLGVFLTAFLIWGCNNDEGPFSTEIPLVPSDTISFSEDIQPLLNSSCVACHTASHPKLNLQACCSYEQLTATGFQAPYVHVADPEESILYAYLTGSPQMMPPSGSLPKAEIDKVTMWIHQGALNN